MYFLKIENAVFDCQDLQTAITKIADATAKNQNWILQNTPFELSDKEIITIIKNTLKEKGLKMSWLAKRLDVTPNHLSRLMNSSANITKKTKNDIFKILEIN